MPLQSQMEKGGAGRSLPMRARQAAVLATRTSFSVDRMAGRGFGRPCPRPKRYDTNLISLWKGSTAGMDRPRPAVRVPCGLDAMADEAILGPSSRARSAPSAAVRTPARPLATRGRGDRFAASATTGRLIYVGAGSSGLIAALDGMELAGTFGWPEERTLFLLAGGYAIATRHARRRRGRCRARPGRDGPCARAEASDTVIGSRRAARPPSRWPQPRPRARPARSPSVSPTMPAPRFCVGRGAGSSRHRPGSHRRLDPDGRRHRAEDGAELLSSLTMTASVMSMTA